MICSPLHIHVELFSGSRFALSSTLVIMSYQVRLYHSIFTGTFSSPSFKTYQLIFWLIAFNLLRSPLSVPHLPWARQGFLISSWRWSGFIGEAPVPLKDTSLWGHSSFALLLPTSRHSGRLRPWVIINRRQLLKFNFTLWLDTTFWARILILDSYLQGEFSSLFVGPHSCQGEYTLIDARDNCIN